MKFFGILVVAILFGAIGLTLWYQNNKNSETSEPRVCFEDNCFSVEIVDDSAERTKGLMNRTFLEDSAGMLFLFDSEALYPFWMKNTLIPLDMIWLNADKEIVAIQENAVPCEADPCPVYNPGTTALYVVELNGGVVSANNIEVGELARFIGIDNNGT